MQERTYFKWKPEDIQFIKDNFELYSCKELADIIGCSVNGVKRKRYDMKIVKSKEALSRIYKRPNAGQFTKGNDPRNTLQDKAITSRVDNKGNVYKWIRLSKANWQMLHVYLWLNSGNEIPKGHIVTFKDGDQSNCVLSNLELITRAESCKKNRRKYLIDKGEKVVTRKETRVRKEVIKKEVVKKVRAFKKKRIQVIEKKLKAKQPVIVQPKKEVKRFAVRMVDYSAQQRVRIDARTSIYIKAGEDAEAARIKYLNLHAKAM